MCGALAQGAQRRSEPGGSVARCLPCARGFWRSGGTGVRAYNSVHSGLDTLHRKGAMGRGIRCGARQHTGSSARFESADRARARLSGGHGATRQCGVAQRVVRIPVTDTISHGTAVDEVSLHGRLRMVHPRPMCSARAMVAFRRQHHAFDPLRSASCSTRQIMRHFSQAAFASLPKHLPLTP